MCIFLVNWISIPVYDVVFPALTVQTITKNTFYMSFHSPEKPYHTFPTKNGWKCSYLENGLYDLAMSKTVN